MVAMWIYINTENWPQYILKKRREVFEINKGQRYK